MHEHHVSDVKQYHQLLGETDPEQSDMDELELQLAALVDSQVGYVTLLQIIYQYNVSEDI